MLHLMAVDSLIMTSGERFDFVLAADQTVSSYWIRFRGLMDWNPQQVFQTAVLRYLNAPETEPEEIVSYETIYRNGTVLKNRDLAAVVHFIYRINVLSKILNPLNHAPGDRQHVTVAELKAIQTTNGTDWTRKPDRKFYLAYDFNAIDNWLYHDPEHYPIFGGDSIYIC